jgi:hypothetical protein
MLTVENARRHHSIRQFVTVRDLSMSKTPATRQEREYTERGRDDR